MKGNGNSGAELYFRTVVVECNSKHFLNKWKKASLNYLLKKIVIVEDVIYAFSFAFH